MISYYDIIENIEAIACCGRVSAIALQKTSKTKCRGMAVCR
ncbi:hypothetical protein [Nostoc sp. LEGE 12450]|nr:hypothetical protein [Nostoc sp. LEGE 12450]